MHFHRYMGWFVLELSISYINIYFNLSIKRQINLSTTTNLFSISIADGTKIITVSHPGQLTGHRSIPNRIHIMVGHTLAGLGNEVRPVPFLDATVHHQGLPLAEDGLRRVGNGHITIEVLGISATVAVDRAGLVAVARP